MTTGHPACARDQKVVKHDVSFIRDGWTEFHQTGGECSETNLSGPVCFRFFKVAMFLQRPPTKRPLLKKG